MQRFRIIHCFICKICWGVARYWESHCSTQPRLRASCCASYTWLMPLEGSQSYEVTCMLVYEPLDLSQSYEVTCMLVYEPLDLSQSCAPTPLRTGLHIKHQIIRNLSD